MDQNRLTHLTDSVGECENLTELVLTENLLQVQTCVYFSAPLETDPFRKSAVSLAVSSELSGKAEEADQSECRPKPAGQCA